MGSLLVSVQRSAGAGAGAEADAGCRVPGWAQVESKWVDEAGKGQGPLLRARPLSRSPGIVHLVLSWMLAERGQALTV